MANLISIMHFLFTNNKSANVYFIDFVYINILEGVGG